MYIYIQEAVFLPTEDRTARSLSLHLPIHHVHHPQVYAYVRALGENKWQPELPFEPLPFASESDSILCANCVCVCCVSVCIRVCREGHVAPKCDQTVKRRVRAGSAATDAVLPCAQGRACGARTHTRWRLLWEQYASFSPDERRPLRPGLAICASACVAAAAAAATAAAADTGLCGRGHASPAKMRRGAAAGLPGCQIGDGSCS